MGCLGSSRQAKLDFLKDRRFQEAVEDQNKTRARTKRFKVFQDMFEDVWSQIWSNMYMLRSVVHVLWVFQMPFLHLAVKTCQLNVAWLEKCPAWLIRSWINLNRQGREEHRGASKAGDLEHISNHSDIFGHRTRLFNHVQCISNFFGSRWSSSSMFQSISSPCRARSKMQWACCYCYDAILWCPCCKNAMIQPDSASQNGDANHQKYPKGALAFDSCSDFCSVAEAPACWYYHQIHSAK